MDPVWRRGADAARRALRVSSSTAPGSRSSSSRIRPLRRHGASCRVAAQRSVSRSSQQSARRMSAARSRVVCRALQYARGGLRKSGEWELRKRKSLGVGVEGAGMGNQRTGCWTTTPLVPTASMGSCCSGTCWVAGMMFCDCSELVQRPRAVAIAGWCVVLGSFNNAECWRRLKSQEAKREAKRPRESLLTASLNTAKGWHALETQAAPPTSRVCSCRIV